MNLVVNCDLVETKKSAFLEYMFEARDSTTIFARLRKRRQYLISGKLQVETNNITYFGCLQKNFHRIKWIFDNLA